jgi:hypothetical protein
MSHFKEKVKVDPERGGLLTIYSCHDDRELTYKKTENYIQISSIDPGTVNLCIRTERRYDSGLIATISVKNEPIKEIIEGKVTNSLTGKEENATICLTYNNLYTRLENIKEDFMTSHIILVERQLPDNPAGCAVMHHMVSHLHSVLKNNALHTIIYVIDSKMKNLGIFNSSLILGGVKKKKESITKRELKKRSIEMAIIYFLMRGEGNNAKNLLMETKADDEADTCTQAEAFCRLLNLPITKWNKKSLNIAYFEDFVKEIPKTKLSERKREIIDNVVRVYQEIEKSQ